MTLRLYKNDPLTSSFSFQSIQERLKDVFQGIIVQNKTISFLVTLHKSNIQISKVFALFLQCFVYSIPDMALFVHDRKFLPFEFPQQCNDHVNDITIQRSGSCKRWIIRLLGQIHLLTTLYARKKIKTRILLNESLILRCS